MANHNGFLEYTADGVRNTFSFYILGMSQPFSLSGSESQTLHRRQFFPKGYSPGNLSIQGQVTSQDDLQRLAKFIRNHHVTLINTPGKMAFTRLDQNSPGYNRLLRLFVVGEDILYRGWVPSFTITKKGVFEPAPKFNMDFFPVFDQHATNIYASRQIQKLWWQQSGSPEIRVSGKTTEKPPTQVEQQPGTQIINTPGNDNSSSDSNITVPGTDITVPH